MRFDPVEEFLEENLVLPITGADGKTRDYEIPPPTAGELIRLKTMHQLVDDDDKRHRSAKGDLEAVGSMSQREIAAHALSEPVVQAMIDDGIPGELFDRAITAGLFWRVGDTDTARAVWSGKAQPQKTRSGRTGGAAGATSKASTSGTSTRKRSPKR